MITIEDAKQIIRIHHAIVMAIAEFTEKDKGENEHIAAHTFAAIITLAYQINKDFAKGTLSEGVAIAEPIAVLIDSAIKNSANAPQTSPSEQAVS